MTEEPELLTIREASDGATHYLNKQVTPSNISYLIQYGRIQKYTHHGMTRIAKQELLSYYQSLLQGRETDWKAALGEDIHWALSFDQFKEADTTKHVHRLHPYKGTFITQRVQYFLDEQTDEFKNAVYFHAGNGVLDPFCGSKSNSRI